MQQLLSLLSNKFSLKKLLKKHIYSLSVKGISVAISFIFAKVYVSKLSTEEFGLFTISYGYIILFSTLIGTGPGLLVVARMKEDKKVRPSLFVLINCSVATLSWMILKQFLHINNLVLYTILITALCYYINETMRINSSGNVYLLQKDIIRSMAGILLIFLNVTDVNYILFYSTVINLFTIFFFSFVFKREMSLGFSLKDFSLKDYTDAMTISLNSSLHTIKAWIEIYLSQIFLSLHEIGLFSILQKLAKLITLPLNALTYDIAKRMVVAIKEGAMSKYLKNQLLLSKITALIFSIFCFVILRHFLKMYGFEANKTNIIVGCCLIIASFVNVMLGPIQMFTQLSNLRRYALFLSITSIVATSILSWLFLPTYGIIGLSIINIVTITGWNSILYYKIKKSTNICL